MKARDIMTAPVITIGPETQVREIVRLLFEKRISGVPVVEDGRVVGLVSEGDLLRRQEIGTDGNPADGSWWARLIKDDPAPAAYVKSHARRARDIMTRDVVSVVEDTSIAEIASLFETRRIKRVPVLRDKELVGIVSRADLIQALAARTKSVRVLRAQTDSAIRKRLLSELAHQSWWHRDSSNVIVTDGVVHYWGLLDSEDERQAARVAAENVPGVRKIEDHRMHLVDLPSML
jgi:CBS domain-containing protein